MAFGKAVENLGVPPNQLEVLVALDTEHGVWEELAQPQGLLDHPQEKGMLLAGTPKSPSQRLARGAPEQYSRLPKTSVMALQRYSNRGAEGAPERGGCADRGAAA